MDKKSQFKLFASQHPELVTYVKSGSMSWQQFYEIYDIYGESTSAWKEYLNPSGTEKLADKLKNIDMNSIQEHIKTAQKALNLVQELTGKSNGEVVKGPSAPRPLNKFFED